ncbi:integrase core domain-containing protein [Corynebacterium macginleyi]|uniref:integrase core domain-containing protein n=1 Tax=Corynebacterium macginleyi TaxID=38290 RepID=UPI003B75C068
METSHQPHGRGLPRPLRQIPINLTPHTNNLTRSTDVVDVEIATFEWVNWWNESRLHQSLGYRTPAEVEAEFWEHHPSREIMGNKAQA